jgi:hypothetical protein
MKLKGTKMGKILIFQEVHEKALDVCLQDLVLFGEENFIEDENGVYDLIFYAKQTYPYDKKNPCSLVIPIVKVFNDDEAINQISNLNSKHPNFTRYAVLNDPLDFYKVSHKQSGREITHLGNGRVV